MTTLPVRLTRLAVSSVLAGGIAAALVLPANPATAPISPGIAPDITPSWSDFALIAAEADDIYLEVTGYTGGDSDAEGFEDFSTAYSVDAGVNGGTATGGGGGGGITPAKPQQLIITKPIDAYTPQFAQTINEGESLQEVVLHMVVAGAQPFEYFTLEARDVLLEREHTSFSVTKPDIEAVRMTMDRLTWTYQRQSTGGQIETFTYCFDYSTNADCN